MMYKPQEYWESRFGKELGIRAVGHIGFDERYNVWLYKAKAKTLKIALDTFQIDIKGKKVLDVGSGMGYFVDYFINQGAKSITGVDITEKSTRFLTIKYPQHRFFTIDIGGNEFTVGSGFDIITAFDVLYHITDEERFNNAIRNMKQVTRKGGYIIFTDMFGTKKISPAEHVVFRSLKRYQEVLKREGCEIIGIIPMFYFLNKFYGEKLTKRSLLLKRAITKCNNLLGPGFFYLDSLLRVVRMPCWNIKLMVCRVN